MRVRAILPPDFIGAPEYEVEFDVEGASVVEILSEAREHLRRCPVKIDSDLPGRTRTLSQGDLLLIQGAHYVVERGGFRRVSADYAARWRRRSLAERMLGSGEYSRVALIPALQFISGNPSAGTPTGAAL